ncbi:PstS family phosphate ABC transporter substrate-binding protein [candidate division KSB1 bacterium]|nr:PstS family phosphate ABC transporter substrate-binding protein [candidate division KSB1 bacterium]
MKRTAFLAVALLTTLLLCVSCSRKEAGQASTSIQIKGSDTMVNLVAAFAEDYMKANKQIDISVTGGGSGTGISALINGTTDICAASRSFKDNEREQAKQRGVNPVELSVGMDGLAVMVNPANPISELALEQIKQIYTGGYTRWSDVGGPDQPIVVLSRESNSGTYVYFQEHVLNKADFAATVRLMPSTGAIVQALRDDKWAIGYGGVAYGENSQIKILNVKSTPDAAAVFPSEAAVHDGSYPIARPLFYYTNGQPTGELKKFVDWCLSPAGQKIVVESGYMTVKKS